MPDSTITIVGNLTREPELKFFDRGTANVKLAVAVTRKWQDKRTQEWQEQTSFFDVVAYGPIAENVANSLTKGTRVVVTGQMEQRSWETEEGQKRYAWELKADEIAPSLRWATAQITKTGSNLKQPEFASREDRLAPREDEYAF